MTEPASERVVFLDKDGVVNSSYPPYVHQWKDVVLYPWTLKAMRMLTEAGGEIFIVTNQSGVGRGYFHRDALENMLDQLLARIAKAGGVVRDVKYCTHPPEAHCTCRKPAPGMLKQLAETYQIDLSRAWMVGDHLVDIEAGKAAGANTILLKSGRQVLWNGHALEGVMVKDDLLDAAFTIIDSWESNI